MSATLQVPLTLDPELIAEYVARAVRDELAGNRQWIVPKVALSITEAAEALSISRSAAYRLVKLGELPSMAIGMTKVVPVAALEDWVREHTTPALAAAS